MLPSHCPHPSQACSQAQAPTRPLCQPPARRFSQKHASTLDLPILSPPPSGQPPAHTRAKLPSASSTRWASQPHAQPQAFRPQPRSPPRAWCPGGAPRHFHGANACDSTHLTDHWCLSPSRTHPRKAGTTWVPSVPFPSPGRGGCLTTLRDAGGRAGVEARGGVHAGPTEETRLDEATVPGAPPNVPVHPAPGQPRASGSRQRPRRWVRPAESVCSVSDAGELVVGGGKPFIFNTPT